MQDQVSLLARIGYEAYGDEADWKNYEGKPMPGWDDLPEHIRVKWSAATRAILRGSRERARANVREAGVVIGKDGRPLYWHLPDNRSGGAIPDSKSLWDVFRENVHEMAGFAHSHPGFGSPGPSYEDLTTFACVEEWAGKRFDWWIATGGSVGLVRWRGPGRLDYEIWVLLSEEQDWVEELRKVSAVTEDGG